MAPEQRPMIDLNCDLGEDPSASGVALDAELCKLVTSINVGCGGHAGDAASTARLARLSRERGLMLGAHPSYPDHAGFGRTELLIDADTLKKSLQEQLLALGEIAAREGAVVSHIKAHGVLYHATMRDAALNHDPARASAPGTSGALLHAIKSVAGSAGFSPSPRIVVQAGPLGDALAAHCGAMGIKVWREAFADRVYEPTGALRARSLPGSLISDPAAAASQAVEIAQRARVITSSGTPLDMTADTICVHSDSPGALAMARAVRAALIDARAMRGIAP